LLEKIPKREFIGFLPIPLGEMNGKTVYVPVARPEANQLIAQVVWALMDGATDEVGEVWYEQLFGAFLSEVPSLHPLGVAIGATSVFVTGGNPYDAFRGINVFNPYTFNYMTQEEKNTEFLKYLGGVLGLSTIVRTYDPRTYGEESSTLQKAHQIPIIGNVIYRLLRETNYGVVETEWNEQNAQAVESRKEKLQTIKMMNEDAKRIIEQGATSKEVEAIIREYQEVAIGYKEPKKGYSGVDATEATRIRKMFKEELLKESGVLPSWRILDMTKNDQKEAELARQQEQMEQGDFVNYLRNLRMAEAISDTFVKSLYEKGYITKSEYEKVVSGDRKKIYIYK
jgi:hypothetical protein